MSKLDVRKKDLGRLDEDDLTPDLVRLDAAGNRLTSPLPGMGHLVDLRWLNLSKNRLTSLDSVASLPSLQVLNVSHNELAGKLSVGRLRGLTALVVNANQITSLGGLEKLNKLETLIVSNNKVAELSGWISPATSLTKLSASNNPVTNFSGIRSLREMKELRLNSTGMREVGDVVRGMSKLRILEVGGGNTIQRFEDLGELPRGLWQLNLKGTPLASTSGYGDEVITRYPHLDVIDGRRLREKGGKARTNRGHLMNHGDGDGGNIDDQGRCERGGKGETNRDDHHGDDNGNDGSEDVLDPHAFKVKAKQPAATKGGLSKQDERKVKTRAEPTKKKRKKVKDIERVLHADKNDQLSAW
jgi:Leucine-rich repeat (LRR) protein